MRLTEAPRPTTAFAALLLPCLLLAAPLAAQQKPLVVAIHGIGGGNRADGWAAESFDKWGVDPADRAEVTFRAEGRDVGGKSFTDFSQVTPEWAGEVQGQIEELARNNPGRELVIVAHSWGTVVTKLALAGDAGSQGGEVREIQLPPGTRIKQLVTLGSPLGRDEAERADPPRKSPLAGSLAQTGKVFTVPGKPRVVDGDWVNIYDPSDPVSKPSHNLAGARNLEAPSSGYSWGDWFRSFIPGVGAHSAVWTNDVVSREVGAAYGPSTGSRNAAAGGAGGGDAPRGGAGGGAGGASWPPDEFNSMRLNWSQSGGRQMRADSSGSSHPTLTVLGEIQGTAFTVSGVAHSNRDDHPCGTQYGDFYAFVEVSLSVDGAAPRDFEDRTPCNTGVWAKPFSLTAPVPASAQEVTFSIKVAFMNPRYGGADRSVNVVGTFYREWREDR